MFIPFRRHSVRPILAGAIALVGLGMFAARDAWASCGDYLYHGPMNAGRSDRAKTNSDGVPVQPAERTCHGPGCRNGNPPIQIPPRVPVLTQRVDQYAISKADLTHSQDAVRVPASDSAAAASRGHRSRIDRPPRA